MLGGQSAPPFNEPTKIQRGTHIQGPVISTVLQPASVMVRRAKAPHYLMNQSDKINRAAIH